MKFFNSNSNSNSNSNTSLMGLSSEIQRIIMRLLDTKSLQAMRCTSKRFRDLNLNPSLMDLPPEIHQIIMRLLDTKSLQALAGASKYFRDQVLPTLVSLIDSPEVLVRHLLVLDGSLKLALETMQDYKRTKSLYIFAKDDLDQVSNEVITQAILERPNDPPSIRYMLALTTGIIVGGGCTFVGYGNSDQALLNLGVLITFSMMIYVYVFPFVQKKYEIHKAKTDYKKNYDSAKKNISFFVKENKIQLALFQQIEQGTKFWPNSLAELYIYIAETESADAVIGQLYEAFKPYLFKEFLASELVSKQEEQLFIPKTQSELREYIYNYGLALKGYLESKSPHSDSSERINKVTISNKKNA